MQSKDSDSVEMARRAMRLAIVITEIPIMVILGYLIGRGAGREFEGALLGAAVGTLLLAASIWPAIKSRR